MSFKIKLPRSKFPGTTETDEDVTMSLSAPLSDIPSTDSQNIGTIDGSHTVNSGMFQVNSNLNDNLGNSVIASKQHKQSRNNSDRNIDKSLFMQPFQHDLVSTTTQLNEQDIPSKAAHNTESTSIRSIIYLEHLVYEPGMRLPSYNESEYKSVSIQHSNFQIHAMRYRWTIYIAACYLTTKSVMNDESKCSDQKDNTLLLPFLYRSNSIEFVNDSEKNYPSYDIKVILEQTITSTQYKIIQVDKIEFGTSTSKDNMVWKCKLMKDSLFRKRFTRINASNVDIMPLGLPSYQTQFIFGVSGQMGIKYSLIIFFEHLVFYGQSNRDILKKQSNISDSLYHYFSNGLSNILKNHILLFETFNGVQYEFVMMNESKDMDLFCFKVHKVNVKPKILCSNVSFREIDWMNKSIRIRQIEYGPMKLFRILKIK